MQPSAPFRLAVIREEKKPVDHRAPLTPAHCKELTSIYKDQLSITVQPSPVRCFPDAAYIEAGATLQEDVSDCDVLIGVKEVPVDALVPGKHYLFFSHTHKLQPYNRKLLKAVLEKDITLTDYECLTYPNQARILGFGRFAGIVGAYNGLLGWGKKTGKYALKPAHKCEDMEELKRELQKVSLGKARMVLTGNGRVAKGAREILEAIGILEVSPQEYLNEGKPEALFTNLDVQHYNAHREGKPFDMRHFFAHGEEYISTFSPYTSCTDLLIAGHFWDNKAPSFFSIGDISKSDFSIRLIADISCDIKEPIPTTLRASSIDAPFYDVERAFGTEKAAFSGADTITVMAVDNLPCELPKDASADFGAHLMEKVIPYLIQPESDANKVIERATIAQSGKLTSLFSYMNDFVAG